MAQFQLVALTAATVCGFALALFAQRAEDAQTTRIRQAIRHANEAIHAANRGPLEFALSRDPEARSSTEKALGSASEALERIDESLPGSSASTGELRVHLQEVSRLAAAFWGIASASDATASQDVRSAILGIAAQFHETSVRMGALDEAARDSARQQQAAVLYRLLWIWASLFSGLVVSSLWARHRFSVELARESSALVDSLREATEALERPGGVVPDVWPDARFAPLGSVIQATQTRLRALEQTLTGEQVRASFAYHLTRRLDLADTEGEVIHTLERATRQALPDRRMSLLLADNSQASLESAGHDTNRVCTPSSPHACPAVRWGRAMVSEPAGGMARCPRLGECSQSVTCMAISIRGQSVGAIQLVGETLTESQVETLGTVTLAVGARLGVVRSMDERELQARTDVLTGLYNRRAMNERLSRMERSGTVFAVIAADLDHFKRLNDTYGHEVGDQCLKIFAQALRDGCRGDDIACRPGGEEFTVILPGADGSTGLVVAERIRVALAEASRRSGRVFTVSMGVAACPNHGTTAEAVLRAADEALYRAKDQGRDRATLALLPCAPSPVSAPVAAPTAGLA